MGNKFACAGCGEMKPAKSTVPRKAAWMTPGAVKREDGMYVVCEKCYKAHCNKFACAGCGEMKPVNSTFPRKAAWMAPGAVKRDDGKYVVCRNCRVVHCTA